MMKKFKQFLNDKNDKTLKLKDIIQTPKELYDIFEICKNEINLSNDDINLSIILFYSKIYFDCLMQYNNLTFGNIDIISSVRKNVVKSNNEKEVKFQYKKITKPYHVLPSDLLKMLTEYKEIKFVDEKYIDYNVTEIMINLARNLFGKSFYSGNFTKQLLNSKITIKP